MLARVNGTAQRRPAEASGIAGSMAILIARAAGVTDPNVYVALATVLGFVPTAVTWLVLLLRRNGTIPPAPPPPP